MDDDARRLFTEDDTTSAPAAPGALLAGLYSDDRCVEQGSP